MSEKEGAGAPDTVEAIRQYLADKLKLFSDPNDDKSEQVLETVDFDGLLKYWNEIGFKKIITMVGAGISTSAGIPDFRSPDTGLYNNLQKYKLPYPTAIFEIDYFRRYPKPFFALARELYPGTFKPTPCHYFIKLLHEKGLLVRHYTQNIDTLERVAGIPEEKLVEAHGTFYTNHCLYCKKEYSLEWMKEKIFAKVPPECHGCHEGQCCCDKDKMAEKVYANLVPKCADCDDIVKPDIVFFGENLPENFYKLPRLDFKDCDLLIIMGTSLEVQPFASLIEHTNSKCVRLLINREPVGNNMNSLKSYLFGEGLHFDTPGNKRDIVWLGDCDEGVTKLAEALGFKDDLEKLIQEGNAEKSVDEKEAKAEK